VNVVAFSLELLFEVLRLPIFERVVSLNGAFLHGFFWQPITYIFLHNTGRVVGFLFFDHLPEGLLLLILDMFILWFIGREVEDYIGAKYFVRLYLLSGLAGAALWLAFNAHGFFYAVGGPVAALSCVIAFGTLFPERELTFILIFIPVTLKAKYVAFIAAGLTLLPLFLYGFTNVTYIGGMAVGYLYIKKLGYGATPRWLAWLHYLDRPFQLFKRRRPQPRPLSDEEYMEEEVDPILDKIAREGIQSLTRREHKILEAAKDHLPKRRR
jgi:hypothetical protein